MTAKEVDMWELEMREVKEESKELDENEDEFDDGEDYEEEDMAEEGMSRDDLDLKREGFVKEEEAAGGPVKKVNHGWFHPLILVISAQYKYKTLFWFQN